METLLTCIDLLICNDQFTLVSFFVSNGGEDVVTFILMDVDEGRYIGQRSFTPNTRFTDHDDLLSELWGSEWLLSLAD